LGCYVMRSASAALYSLLAKRRPGK
jgi:hypothetical protein